jgi:hypothetical protein
LDDCIISQKLQVLILELRAWSSKRTRVWMHTFRCWMTNLHKNDQRFHNQWTTL